MLNWIDPLHDANIPVEDLLVIVIFGLDDLVAYLKPPAKPLDSRFAVARRVRGIEPAPDFIFDNDALGIEVTELLRPDDNGISPVAAESFHKQIVPMAQKAYYSAEDAKPARIVLYFANARGKKQNKAEMARMLAAFVRANVHLADPVVNFSGLQLPDGFGSMSIASESGNWLCEESGEVTLSEIFAQLVSRIMAKNNLVPTYRARLRSGAQVWLLIYTRQEVSRSVPIPQGIEELKVSFDFDRVFWLNLFEGEIVEIRRQS